MFPVCTKLVKNIHATLLKFIAGDRERELDRDRDSIFRIRDHRRRMETFRDEAAKSLDREKTESSASENAKKNNQPAQSPLILGEDLQYWTNKVCVTHGIY